MSTRYSNAVASLALLAGVLFGPNLSLAANAAKAFPTENAYSSLYNQAMNQGYPELARGVAVFRQYRSGVENCAAEGNSMSSKAFGEFLDSVVINFQGYLNSSNLRNRGVRNNIAGYVTQCAALIETYAKARAEKFNGGENRLDSVDENLVATSRQLHREMAGLLRVGAPSIDGAIAQWQSADLNQWVGDGRFGKAADSILKVESGKDAYCRATL